MNTDFVFQKKLNIQDRESYREQEAIFEVREFFVTFLTSEHSILLVHHLLVAVFTGAGLIQAVLFTNVDYGADAGEIISLTTEDKLNKEAENTFTLYSINSKPLIKKVESLQNKM